MSRSPVRSTPRRSLLAGLVLALSFAACGPGGSSGSPGASGLPASPGTTQGSGSPPGGVTKLTVGLGYIPSVQFAQFYLAQRAGYYRDAGLEITFQNRIDPELITLVGQGAVDIGIADGTSVIPAVSQGIPIRYIASIYGRFPNVVFAPAASGIGEAADLKGKRIGTPGKYGSGWIMLQALLASAELTPADAEIVLFPDFSQQQAVADGRVDGATGFANNEPVQLELAGTPTNVLRIDEVTPLPGPGLIAGTSTIASKRDALRAFVAATLRAMREIEADPDRGLEAAIAAVPELGSARDAQRQVLTETVVTWESDYTAEHGFGSIDRTAWERSVEFMQGLPDRLVARPVTVDELVSEELLP
jgi:NitT/TauT family transport system substrate-binding protein